METNNLLETTGMQGSEYHNQFQGHVDWTDKNLQKIVRTRFITGPGCPFYDVTYCHGIMKDGRKVNVVLPFYQLKRTNWKSQIITAAKVCGVYAKGLGLFESISILS